LTTHSQWGPYLSARAHLVTELANQIRATARQWQPATAPAWARPLLHRQPQLMAEIAVFRAAHDVDAADTRMTGPDQHATRSATFQQLLHARIDTTLRRGEPGAQRWRALADSIDGHITADPFWPLLATHLETAARAGANIAELLHKAITRDGALPDELPAAALWWRLAGTLAPATLNRAHTRLRPPWTPELHHLLGSAIAEIVIADSAWPSLVAAVAASGWPPADLLAAAAEHLRDIAQTEHLRPDEYARLLTYRIELLTHHAATIDPDIPHPADTPGRRATGDPDLVTDRFDPADIHLEDEPPPDPYDYAYGLAEDTLGDLDFHDLPRHRPTPLPGVDVDIVDLRARRHATRQRAENLARAILHGGGGPAEQAAATELAELHRRHHHQRHHQHHLAHAHADWIAAEHTAEIHRNLLDHLAAQRDAAAQRGDHHLADNYASYYKELSQHTTDIDTAIIAARQRLAAARGALLDLAGGVEGIVTERDIHSLRAAALDADTQALHQTRTQAVELTNQTARAEAAAARAFAENRAAAGYDLAAELPSLRAEIDCLDAAGARSPAAMYRVPDEALSALDPNSQSAVIAIANSAQAIHTVELYEGVDKAAVLEAIAAAAHHHQRSIVGVPATQHAAEYAAGNRYADTTTTPSTGQDNPASGRWTLPIGSLVIVDDADHLDAGTLRYLTENAAATNTKLLLLTTPNLDREPAHTLTTVLATNLPWAQQLGTPAPNQQRTATAIDRAEHYLATTAATDIYHAEAARLIHRRNHLINRYRDLTKDLSAAQSTSRDRGSGLEL
jgi:hypothetical protein